MKCLVTGSSGFIGSHLVKALLRHGCRVEGLDTMPSRFHKVRTHTIDVTDPEAVERTTRGFDFVFHLAGLLGTDELQGNAYRATAINIGGTVNVLEACFKSGTKMILASKPNVWLNTYSITKIAAEQFLHMYRKEYGVQAAILKWFNVYGPYQRLMDDVGYKKFIPHAIMNALRGLPIEVYGNGDQIVDLVHTSDTVSALLGIVDNWSECEGGCFEVGNCGASVNEVIDILSNIAGRKLEVTHLAMRRGEPENSKVRADITALNRATDWVPAMSLMEGLRHTFGWYREYYECH